MSGGFFGGFTMPLDHCPFQSPEVEVGNANDDAFLMCLRACEGTLGEDGYRTIFGGQHFEDFDRHPRVLVPFKNKDGIVQNSTAAGAFQINWPTYQDIAPKVGVTDFTPAAQDAMANWLIDHAGAREDIRAGRLQAALDKCAGRWASLPASTYPQPTRSYAFAAQAFRVAGGTISNLEG